MSISLEVRASKHDPWYASASDEEIDAHPAGQQIREQNLGEHVSPKGTNYRLVNHGGRFVSAHVMPSGRRAGALSWFGGKHDPEKPSTTHGVIYKIGVSGPHRRKGLASAMLDFAREKHPEDSIAHSTALSEDGKAWSEKKASKENLDHLETEMSQEALDNWRPHDRIFGPTRGGVDPRLFGDDQKMLPDVRLLLMTKMNRFMERHGGPHWTDWARMYLAGSQASEWYGNNDFDILVGVDYDGFRKATGSHLRNEEITDDFNKAFRADWNDEQWHPEFEDGGTWHLTGYVNPDSWDIRRIKPYAAYEIVSDTWFVKPVETDEHWGADRFPESVWRLAEHYANEIQRISTLKPASVQKQYAGQLFNHIHTDRSRAFGPRGSGVFDTGNVVEKYLDQRPDHPLAMLVEMKNQALSKTASADPYTHRHINFDEDAPTPSQEEAHNSDSWWYHGHHQMTHSGNPVAKLDYTIERNEPNVIHVDALATHPAHRGAGLASRLMDHMQDHAEREGMTINHGSRTKHGRAWWGKYSQGDSFKPHLHEPDTDSKTDTTDESAEGLAKHVFTPEEMAGGYGRTASADWDEYYDNQGEHDHARNLRIGGTVHNSQGRVLAQHRIAVISEPEQEHRLSSLWFPEHQSSRFKPVQGLIHGARAYAAMKGLPDPHDVDFHKVVTTPQDVRETGRAYDALPEHDRSADHSFDSMRKEVGHQYDHLTGKMGIKVEPVDHDPYADVHEMTHDVEHNKRLKVLRTAATGSHPLFSNEDNDKFRAVHDAFGHAATGRGFDRHGEQAAFVAHSKMFTPAARGALATETKGQNASLNLNGEFAPQKIALLPSQYGRTAKKVYL